MFSRTTNYILVFILLVSFTASLYNIKTLQKKDKETKRTGRIVLPIVTIITFFVACYFISVIVSEGPSIGKDKYTGIYFILIAGVILTIMNLTILSKDKLDEYIKGKKFNVSGLFMALGISAIVFGFLDNFGLKLGIEALDESFLHIFLSPFSIDNRFTKYKQNIEGNLKHVNNWVSGDWRKVINHVLRFEKEISEIPKLKDLSNAIKSFDQTQLNIPEDILKSRSLTNQYVDNIRDKYDIIDSSKAMLGNTFSDFIGAILGAALINLFIYMTNYDGFTTGDETIDNNFFVKHLNKYMPFLEAFFISLGCLIPVFLNIAMNKYSNKRNNKYSWYVVSIIGIIMLIMMFISSKGVKNMTPDDKKNSIKKNIKNIIHRVNLSDNTTNKLETNLSHKLNEFLVSLDNLE